jgi:chemotaxis protein CheX
MKDRLYKAFVDATHNVFQLMLNISEISDHPTEDFKCDEVVDISIGITGDLHGKVIYRFPVSTSLNMVSIMSGMQFEEVDDFVTSAISEIANIISGNVMTALSDNDIKCDILPPVQYKPSAEDEKEKEYEMKTSCCLGTTIGDVCLEIRLNRAS